MEIETEKCLFCDGQAETFFTRSFGYRVWFDCGQCGGYAISRKMHDHGMYAVEAWISANSELAKAKLAEAKARGRRLYFSEPLFKPYW
jgi:hypothetical protein